MLLEQRNIIPVCVIELEVDARDCADRATADRYSKDRLASDTFGAFFLSVSHCFSATSNSSMHHYECTALCKVISLHRGRFCARSLASCIPRSSKDRLSWMFFMQVVRGRPGGRLRWSNTNIAVAELLHRYGNSHAIWDHTVLPATRQRWHSRLSVVFRSPIRQSRGWAYVFCADRICRPEVQNKKHMCIQRNLQQSGRLLGTRCTNNCPV